MASRSSWGSCGRSSSCSSSVSASISGGSAARSARASAASSGSDSSASSRACPAARARVARAARPDARRARAGCARARATSAGRDPGRRAGRRVLCRPPPPAESAWRSLAPPRVTPWGPGRRLALVPAPEPVDSAGGVHQTLLAGEVRMALGADFDVDRRGRRAGLERVPAGADGGQLAIGWVQIGLHLTTPLPGQPLNLGGRRV